MKLETYIKDIPNFPKNGIIFKDVAPLLASPKAFQATIDLMASYLDEIDVVISPDARGFLFGTAAAYKTAKPFIMVRKPGKLPGQTLSQSYELEYGHNTLEIQANLIKPGQKVAIIDDVLATGGTIDAMVKLVAKQQASVTKIIVLLELKNLKAKKIFDDKIQIHSLIKA